MHENFTSHSRKNRKRKVYASEFGVKLKRVLLNFALSRYVVNGNLKNLGRSGLVRRVRSPFPPLGDVALIRAPRDRFIAYANVICRLRIFRVFEVRFVCNFGRQGKLRAHI